MKLLQPHTNLQDFQDSIMDTIRKTHSMEDPKLKERFQELLLGARSNVAFIMIYGTTDPQKVIENIQQGVRNELIK